VDVIRELGEIGASGVPAELADHRRADADRRGSGLDVAFVSRREVGPEELTFVEPAGQAWLRIDFAVATIGVVQPNAKVAAGPLRTVQRARARIVTTTIATSAVPYWRTFMATSARPARRDLGAPTGTPSTTGLTIDVLSSCK
jgi:hypothetical protein